MGTRQVIAKFVGVFVAGLAALALLPGSAAAQAVDCAGGEIYDDGETDGAVGGAVPGVETFEAQQQFNPPGYPYRYDTACVSLVGLSDRAWDFELVVYDDDGADGTPGTELGSVPATGQLAEFNFDYPGDCGYTRVDISSLGLVIDEGSVFLGVRWQTDNDNAFICHDNTAETPVHPHFYNFNLGGGWSTPEDAFVDSRVAAIRAEGRVLDRSLAPEQGAVEFTAAADGTVRMPVSFRSTGEVPVTVDGATILGAGAASFSTVSNGCAAAPVGPGALCQVVVEYSGAAGDQSAVLSLDSNGSDSPAIAVLNGSTVPAPDPSLKLKRKLKGGKTLKATVGTNVSGKIVVKGSIKPKKKGKAVRLKKVVREIADGKTKLKLKPKNAKSKKALKRYVKRGTKLVAKAKVKQTNSVGAVAKASAKKALK